jgi:hypothetical protein
MANEDIVVYIMYIHIQKMIKITQNVCSKKTQEKTSPKSLEIFWRVLRMKFLNTPTENMKCLISEGFLAFPQS